MLTNVSEMMNGVTSAPGAVMTFKGRTDAGPGRCSAVVTYQGNSVRSKITNYHERIEKEPANYSNM